jgi:predicted secreted protein
MTALAGKGGKVLINTSTFVAEIDSWKIDSKAGTEDVTPFATDSSTVWKTFVSTLKEWSGSFEGRLDLTDTNGQLAILNTYLGGSATTAKFYIDATHYLTGSIIISGMGAASEVGGVVKVSVSFQGTGQLSYA